MKSHVNIGGQIATPLGTSKFSLQVISAFWMTPRDRNAYDVVPLSSKFESIHPINYRYISHISYIL